MPDRRMSAENRKRQIVQVALQCVDKYGIQGTTTSRIARGAGVSQAALYVHFKNREKILSAVLDAVYDDIYRIGETASRGNVIDGLREAAQIYSQFVCSDRKSGHAHLMLEFVTDAHDDHLREAIAQKQLAATKQFADIIERGKQRGDLPPDVDSELLAWMVCGWSWALIVAQLMGLRSAWHPRVSSALLDAIIQSATQRESWPVPPG